jgi:hypothetical protein
MTLRDRYEDHDEVLGTDAEGSFSDSAGRRRTKEGRAMYIQELKERVARAEYAIDTDAVAAAIIRRMRVVQHGAVVASRPQVHRQGSREVVKSR